MDLREARTHTSQGSHVSAELAEGAARSVLGLTFQYLCGMDAEAVGALPGAAFLVPLAFALRDLNTLQVSVAAPQRLPHVAAVGRHRMGWVMLCGLLQLTERRRMIALIVTVVCVGQVFN